MKGACSVAVLVPLALASTALVWTVAPAPAQIVEAAPTFTLPVAMPAGTDPAFGWTASLRFALTPRIELGPVISHRSFADSDGSYPAFAEALTEARLYLPPEGLVRGAVTLGTGLYVETLHFGPRARQDNPLVPSRESFTHLGFTAGTDFIVRLAESPVGLTSGQRFTLVHTDRGERTYLTLSIGLVVDMGPRRDRRAARRPAEELPHR